ncbi:phosphohistidine phosphatase [Balneicella halophila]|uniref:Phosphohistidine phosphatase n=1 Tax=Balneicella halophila TaxID=1537566 RepID=A0A7L4US52_BALHA|nr:histidine phosphatase family protein [Balneicella halophila]PVX52590.1 phosphohistidine phosphatase [Balneicella halophila]
MKRIILLRHAKTEPYDYHKNDFKRNLTERGKADSHIITAVLERNGYKIDHIVSSSANRAQQTATLFAEDFNLDKELIECHQSIYDGLTTQDLLNLLSSTDDGIETLLFVGHNPDIARFAYRLTKDFSQHAPTCCAIVLETEIETWKNLGEKDFKLKDIFIPKTYK